MQTKTLLATTKKDVEDFLGTRKTHKSIGSGSIPTRSLKELKCYFSKPISNLRILTGKKTPSNKTPAFTKVRICTFG